MKEVKDRGIGTEEGQMEYCYRLIDRLEKMIGSEDIHAEVEILIEDVKSDTQSEKHQYIWDTATPTENLQEIIDENEGETEHITTPVENCPDCAREEIGKVEIKSPDTRSAVDGSERFD